MAVCAKLSPLSRRLDAQQSKPIRIVRLFERLLLALDRARLGAASLMLYSA